MYLADPKIETQLFTVLGMSIEPLKFISSNITGLLYDGEHSMRKILTVLPQTSLANIGCNNSLLTSAPNRFIT